MQRAYKYRIYPTETQEATLTQHFGIGRYVFNFILDRKNEEYKAYKAWQETQGDEKPKSKTSFDYNPVITALKKELDWVGDAGSQTLQEEIRHVFAAFDKFYKTIKERKSRNQSLTNKKGNLIGFPRYKSRPFLIHKV